ncbi:hypothetical protein Misp01_69350 [Microtetraspora sp. NBRC 13810]|uniref:AAA family ATPase n=1 Tax=Microtetraspora sp. NBRC 13810 TaxID=3030990 RepID=UPI0024A349AA|nr:AAA family ATPase [Microtetraspora sp. NBRC 13810]GLW11807.1 hypothetical protein Misp01_69350 [Microtetraspora sp. NBRC 13810]
MSSNRPESGQPREGYADSSGRRPAKGEHGAVDALGFPTAPGSADRDRPTPRQPNAYDDHPRPGPYADGPPPGYGDQGPPPGYGDQGPPPGYGDQGPPPGYGDQGPPPGYGDQGPPPGYGDQGPPPGYGDKGGPPPGGYGEKKPSGGIDVAQIITGGYPTLPGLPAYPGAGRGPGYDDDKAPGDLAYRDGETTYAMPVRSHGYDASAPLSGGYDPSPRPAPDSGYDPRPGSDTGYDPRPGSDAGYDPRPGSDGGYEPSPRSGSEGGYESRPGPDGGYDPASRSGSEGGYESRPGSDGGYDPAPRPGSDGGYEPRPGADGGYEPSPRSGSEGGYDPRAGSDGGYDLSPRPGSDGAYDPSPRPGADGGFDPRPGSDGGYDPRPGSDGGFDPRPGSDGGYEPRPGSDGGYDARTGSDGGYDSSPRSGVDGGYDPRPASDSGYDPSPRPGTDTYDRPGSDPGYDPRPAPDPAPRSGTDGGFEPAHRPSPDNGYRTPPPYGDASPYTSQDVPYRGGQDYAPKEHAGQEVVPYGAQDSYAPVDRPAFKDGPSYAAKDYGAKDYAAKDTPVYPPKEPAYQEYRDAASYAPGQELAPYSPSHQGDGYAAQAPYAAPTPESGHQRRMEVPEAQGEVAALAAQFAQRFELLAGNVEKVIKGRRDVVELALICLFSEGHLLVEGVPGTGKTTLARAIAAGVDARLRRVQFTPDLLPSDITGVSVFDPQAQRFEFHEGPVFGNIVLADEINRAAPKTQAALLEVMEERRVTVGAESRPVPRPFLVLATRSPADTDASHPLPEAQLDRFLMCVPVGYPDHAAEVDMLRNSGAQVEQLPLVARASDVAGMIDFATRIHVADPIYDFVVGVVAGTRTAQDTRSGASPRAGIGLLRAARVRAAAAGRHYVVPEDVKALAVPVLAHRLALTPEAQARGRTAADLVEEICAVTPVPPG